MPTDVYVHKGNRKGRVLCQSEGYYWIIEETAGIGRSHPFTVDAAQWTVPTPEVGDVWSSPFGTEFRVLGVTDTTVLLIRREDYNEGRWVSPRPGVSPGDALREVDITDSVILVERNPLRSRYTFTERPIT